MRIPQQHYLTLDLCKKYKIPLSQFDDRSKYHFRGAFKSNTKLNDLLKSNDYKAEFGIEGFNLPDDVIESLAKPGEDYKCIKWEDMVKKYDNHTVRTWINQHLDLTKSELIHYSLIQNAATTLDVNLIDFASTEVLHYQGQNFYMVPGGFDKIPRHLADDLSTKAILFNSKVHRIVRNNIGSPDESVR